MTSAVLTQLRKAADNNARAYTERRSILAPKPTPRPAAPAQKPIPANWKDMLPLIEQVPAGHYALTRKDGSLGFVRVTKIKGTNRTFICEIVGAPSDFREIRMSVKVQWFTAQHLLEDVKRAAKTFADERRVCARCLSPLTDPASRARGFGPTCVGYYR